MHMFIDAIGFGHVYSRPDLERLACLIQESPTSQKMVELESGMVYGEIRKDFAPGMGLALVGEYDTEHTFHMTHYFPYYNSVHTLHERELTINHRVDTDSFTVMTEDFRLGVSLIFFLTNPIDYLIFRKNDQTVQVSPAMHLCALSTKGTILLGCQSDTSNTKKPSRRYQRQAHLMKEAMQGNPEAINQLTLNELDLYATISRRIQSEDLYSIVTTTFYPFGSESDTYSMIGTIQQVKELKNSLSNEEIYVLTVNCNDLPFDILINKRRLTGIPAPGCRFKGNVWLQGQVDFSDK